MPKRSYSSPKSGSVYGNLTLVKRVMQSGTHGEFSDGLWLALCPWGKKITLTTREINRGSLKLQGCGGRCGHCKPYARSGRILGFKSRPGSQRHTGRVYGRLTVKVWIDGEGWSCMCECGEPESVRRSSQLGARGAARCSHSPNPNPDTADV